MTYCGNANKALHTSNGMITSESDQNGQALFPLLVRQTKTYPHQLTLRRSRAAASPSLQRQSAPPLRLAGALPTAAAADEHAGHVRVPSAVVGRRRGRRSAARRRHGDRGGGCTRRRRRRPGVWSRAAARGHDIDHDVFRHRNGSSLPSALCVPP